MTTIDIDYFYPKTTILQLFTLCPHSYTLVLKDYLILESSFLQWIGLCSIVRIHQVMKVISSLSWIFAQEAQCKFVFFYVLFIIHLMFRSVLDDEVRVRLPPRVFDSEYYDLPPIENISLNDKPIVKPLGFVANIIDFVGKLFLHHFLILCVNLINPKLMF